MYPLRSHSAVASFDLSKCRAGGWDRKGWQRWGRLTTKKVPVNNGFRANNQLDIPVGLFGLFRAFRKSSTHVLRFFPRFFQRTRTTPNTFTYRNTAQKHQGQTVAAVMSSIEKGKEGLCPLSVLKVRSSLVFVHQIIVPVTNMSLLMLPLVLHSPP